MNRFRVIAGAVMCLTVAGAIGAPDTSAGELYVYLDIRPGSCPNPLNRASQGVLPAALLGQADLDVMQIDTDSLRIMRNDGVGGAVAPLDGPPGPGMSIQDVTAPFGARLWCGCEELRPDGFDDLILKFSIPELVSELELSRLDGSNPVELIIIGELLDGTPFSGTDCITLVGQSIAVIPSSPGERAGH